MYAPGVDNGESGDTRGEQHVEAREKKRRIAIGSAEMTATWRCERGNSLQSVVVAAVLMLAALGLKAQGAGQQNAAGGGADRMSHPGLNYVQGEVIVKLKVGRSGGIQILSEDVTAQKDRASLLRLRAKYGLEDKGHAFKRLDGARGYHVLTTQGGVLSVCAELNADPDVEYAQPNYIYRSCKTPNDPDFADQYAHQLIQMEDAWDICTGSRDVRVAVIGSGVDVNHPDLKDNIWVNPGETSGNGLDDDENGFVDDIHGWNFFDDSGLIAPFDEHETQVAGVIAAAGNNGVGVVGVNWQCSIMVLEVDYSSEQIAAALDYAVANVARVINMSLGTEEFGPEGDSVVRTAVEAAARAGVLLVASAGNSDTSRPNYPAAYPNVMAVASTDGEDAKTGHSSFGAWVDIAAPGTDIVTTDYDGQYVATAGTSFSSPYVAGVAALLLAYRPTLTAMEVRAILENTTDLLYYGDVDPNVGYIGTGRVNAYRALRAVDEALPLGEIVAPQQNQAFAADIDRIEICAFVHGDSCRSDYRLYGQTGWTAIPDGGAADPNGFVRLSLANPGAGTYELRLRVTVGENTHTDRKVFIITAATNQAPGPFPEDPTSEEYWSLYFMGSPLCLDINGDGRNEIIQSTFDDSSYFSGGAVNIWTQDGNSLPNWPVQMGTYGWPSSLAVGDIDGDGDYEVVAGSEMDGEVCAYHVESGRIVDGNWPAAVGGWYGYIAAGPVLADLDGDGDSEILVALDLESMDTDGLIALQGDGTYLWQRRYTATGPMSVADFDRDGDAEIGLCGLGPGLSRVYTFILDNQGQQVARWKGGSPKGTAVADLDADGKTEMVFCTELEVMAVRADGSTLWKTRVTDPMSAEGGLCIADLDNNGLSEVYVTTYVEGDGFLLTKIYAFDHKGRLLADAGYPKTILGDPTRIVPLAGDIDGDGAKELVVGPAGEPIMAWEADGSATPGFPLLSFAADAEATPVIADLDQDGNVEIMVACYDYRFRVMDMAVPYDAALVDWGAVRHDPQNSGWTVAWPQVNPISAPSEILLGGQIEVHVSASNPADLPLRWFVGNLPDGASYDAENLTLVWKPAADQVFGTYAFSFLVTDGVRQSSRSVSVTVLSDAIYSAGMSTDPNWRLDEGWAWGAPVSGTSSPQNDPNAGHTGANVIGYALGGDYKNYVRETRYATTGPIDCRSFKNIRLSFWRWLGIASPGDRACVQVSNDGANWTDLWTTGRTPIMDGDWQFIEYAVGADIGDNQPTVYFRWGFGPSDRAITSGGWNIDDVQVTGDRIE